MSRHSDFKRLTYKFLALKLGSKKYNDSENEAKQN